MVSISGDNWRVAAWTGTAHPWRVNCSLNNVVEIDAIAPVGQPEYIRNGSYAETAAFLQAMVDCAEPPAPGLAESFAAAECAWRIQGGSRPNPFYGKT